MKTCCEGGESEPAEASKVSDSHLSRDEESVHVGDDNGEHEFPVLQDESPEAQDKSEESPDLGKVGGGSFPPGVPLLVLTTSSKWSCDRRDT